MKIYLIDFENVKSKGLTGIDKLDETDNVIIFYSENSDTISFEMHQKVLTSKAEIEYYKVNVGGKNALDFQLSTLLGYLVAKNLYSHIFVISNDRGFDFLHDFWHGKYVDVPNTIVYRTRTIFAAINFAAENTGRQFADASSATPNVQEHKRSDEYEGAAEIPAFAEIIQKIDTDKDSSINIEKEKNEDNKTIPDHTSAKTENAQLNHENIQEDIPSGEISLKPQEYYENLEGILSSYCTQEDIGTISGFIITSDTKEELHNSLAKVFKQQATELYKLLRPKYLWLKALYAKENPVLKKQEITQEENIEFCAPNEANTAYNDVISAKINELTNNNCTKEELEKIRYCISEAATKQQFYIKMVKAFRKEKGCEYYNMIRSEYLNLSKQAQEI